jgi:hypothetical protein
MQTQENQRVGEMVAIKAVTTIVTDTTEEINKSQVIELFNKSNIVTV